VSPPRQPARSRARVGRDPPRGTTSCLPPAPAFGRTPAPQGARGCQVRRGRPSRLWVFFESSVAEASSIDSAWVGLVEGARSTRV
jgi:hypothetical protein